MFDGSKHDLQGNKQYYYLISCDVSDKSKIPYSMLGKHIEIRSGSKITGLDYITLELYDNWNNKYLVFLSSVLRYYVLETDQVSTLYDENVENGISLTTLAYDESINIGERFVILINRPNSKQIDVTLITDGKCNLEFTMKAQRYWWGRYRMHYFRLMPPTCYERDICGVLGDFKDRGYRSQKLPQCNGDVINVVDSMSWSKAYDPDGMSWEKTYVDGYCGGYYAQDDDNEIETCDELIQDEVIATCQRVRDEQQACCNSIGGDFCDAMQTWCEFDACVTSQGDATQIDGNVYDLFTDGVVETCQDCAACFGPIPKLLYEFDGNLKESQSNGDDKYDLQTAGDANVANGVLNCDGDGDYAFNIYDLNLNMTSHSLEVLVSLDNVYDINGGGTISIYNEDQFDSIVFNGDE